MRRGMVGEVGYRTMMVSALRDQMGGTYRGGGGADNPVGLHLESHGEGETAVAARVPNPVSAAGPSPVLDAIIATLLDIPGVGTARR